MMLTVKHLSLTTDFMTTLRKTLTIQEKCWCIVSKSANLSEHLQVRHNLTICEDFCKKNSEILAFFTKSGFVAFICIIGYFFAIFDYIEDDLNLKALIKASKVS